MRSITILEFPSNLGLKEPSPGHEPGIKKLPEWLRKHNLHQLLKPVAVHTLTPPAYTMNIDKVSGVRNADAIIEYAKEQEIILRKVLADKTFPIVIGGDCSILIGNFLALKKTGNYGLFFLDGHTDFMWPQLSQTAGAAGMDLAIIAGYGHDKLTNIDNQKPYVKEEFAWCAGNREYDAKYIKLILDSKINYFDLNDLRKTGIKNCIPSFLDMIDSQHLDGFWIHIDVDVLNDNIMPAVDSRNEDGISYTEFKEILALLLSARQAAGIEITILDPELDPTGEYTREFVTVFCDTIRRYLK